MDIEVNQAKTILIVDDDSFNLLVLENILKTLQLESIKAFNGQEAVDIIKNNYQNNSRNKLNFKFIFMDY